VVELDRRGNVRVSFPTACRRAAGCSYIPAILNWVYLLKGGAPDVWRKFGVLRLWRKPQGLILGERCGITQNIGPAARKGVMRLKEHRLCMGGRESPPGQIASRDV
jgi:hypothetical protein